MRMHNVVIHPVRLLQNLNGAFQIVQFGPEPENIDDIDGMTELAQLLCLLPHESSIRWPLRTGIHVRNKQDSHGCALPSRRSSRTATPFELAIASLYSPIVSSTILVIEKSRLSLASPVSPIRLAIVGLSSRYSIVAATASEFAGGTRNPVSPSTTSSLVPPPSVATTGLFKAMYSIMLFEQPSTKVHSTPMSKVSTISSTFFFLPRNLIVSTPEASRRLASRVSPSPTMTNTTSLRLRLIFRAA